MFLLLCTFYSYQCLLLASSPFSLAFSLLFGLSVSLSIQLCLPVIVTIAVLWQPLSGLHASLFNYHSSIIRLPLQPVLSYHLAVVRSFGRPISIVQPAMRHCSVAICRCSAATSVVVRAFSAIVRISFVRQPSQSLFGHCVGRQPSSSIHRRSVCLSLMLWSTQVMLILKPSLGLIGSCPYFPHELLIHQQLR